MAAFSAASWSIWEGCVSIGREIRSTFLLLLDDCFDEWLLSSALWAAQLTSPDPISDCHNPKSPIFEGAESRTEQDIFHSKVQYPIPKCSAF
jgi:hypothetical protein